jgi:hypothetical protein
MKQPLIIFILITKFCFAQQYQNGLILPDFNKIDQSEACCIYSPKEGFSIFDSANGNNIGTLTKITESNKDDQAPYKIFFIDKSTETAKQIELSKFKEIGYEIWAITYFERKSGFVRIVESNVDYWLSEKEIEEKDFKVENWKDFLISKTGRLLGYYANNPGLNLRALPSKDSDLILTFNGDLFEIIPTEQTEGNWVKVKVIKYKEHPCISELNQNELIEEKFEGWLKLIDDNGLPNVWYYSRGC